MVRLLAGMALVVVLAGAAPAAPAAADDCGSGQCGVPNCWNTEVRARPAHARRLSIYCERTESVEVLEQPAHATVSDVAKDWMIRFTLTVPADAPAQDRFVLRLHGPEATVDVPVDVEIIPLTQNSAPICAGDRVTQRTDGSGPVTIFAHPSCHDPEGDEFVMEGGGPGTHPYSPRSVPAEEGESNWLYTTAISSGTENATLWATDYLGARSPNAELKVTIGPEVDSPSWCHPSMSWWMSTEAVQTVNMRPGVRRHFGLLCEDADQDPFVATLSTPPDRGTMAEFVQMPLTSSFIWGAERYVDVTYLPADESTEPDPFAVTAVGERGSGPNIRMQMVPVPEDENGGGGCGWSSAQVVPDTAGVVRIFCGDTEGDPMTAELVDGPLHGTAGPPVVLEGLYGDQEISVPYVPDPGHKGYDCVKVRISDGHGMEFLIVVDIEVREPPPVPPLPELPVTVPPVPVPLPAPPALPGPVTAADLPAFSTRAEAQDALMSLKVRRLRTKLPVEVWAPAKLSRRAILTQGRVPSFFIACPQGCTARSLARLVSGKRPLAASAGRRGGLVQAGAGQATLVWLDASRLERRALRRARHPRAAFTLGVRVGGSPRETLRGSLGIGG